MDLRRSLAVVLAEDTDQSDSQKGGAPSAITSSRHTLWNGRDDGMAKEPHRAEPDRSKIVDDSDGGGVPDVDVSNASARKQLNVPKEVLDRLEQLADATGHKVATLAVDAINIFVMLMADASHRGELMPSATSNRLRRLAIQLQMPMGRIVRASASIGCKLMEEDAEPPEPGRVLLDDVVAMAQAQKKSVADLIADYVRRGLREDGALKGG
jgi:hypothetical protein